MKRCLAWLLLTAMGAGSAVAQSRAEATYVGRPLTDVLREMQAGGVKAYHAYEAELKKNNIPYEGHIWPNSVHGFFNDATPERYNKETAAQAWTRTIAWFNQYARPSS